MIGRVALVCLLCSVAGWAAAAQTLNFHAPTTVAGAATESAMRSLAERALPVYENPNRAAFLANLSALQIVAGEYAAAYATRKSLHEFREEQNTARPVDLAVIYDLYAQARARAVTTGQPFSQTFAELLQASLGQLSDRNAFTLTQWLATPLSLYRENLLSALERLRGHDHVSVDEAVRLAWLYVSYTAFRSFGPFVGKLIAADNARRYVEHRAQLPGPHRERVAVLVIRPKRASAPLPALLEFTPDAQARDRALECAAHGYVGAVARMASSARGAHRAHSPPVRAAQTVIDWIARQGWSDGRVGLYGTGASAFTAWRIARHPPRALVALAVSSVAAPADARGELQGQALRRPRHRHPSDVHLSVLTTTGYFDIHEPASLAVFEAEQRSDSNARERLLIGPYDSKAMRRGALPVIGGYAIDARATVDLRKLRFNWFDHVLRGMPLSGLLAGRVNYEVMAANVWRHARSVAAMGNGSIRLYLHDRFTGADYSLTGHEPSHRQFVEVPVGAMAARALSGPATGSEGAANAALVTIVSRTIPPHGVAFVSGPLYRPLEVSGRVSGELDLGARLAGLSVGVDLYELRAGGEYFRFLSLPNAICGGCSARTRRRDRLYLRRRVAFTAHRLTSVRLPAGSRIVLVLDARTRASAPRRAAPTHHQARKAARPVLKWYGGSFIELPTWRAGRS